MKKLLLLAPITVLAGSPQVWTQTDVSHSFGPVKAIVSEENRTGIKSGWHFDEIHVAPSVEWSACEWLDIGASYRHVLLRDGSDTRWTQDRRPGIGFRLKHSIYSWSLSNRSRFIARDREGDDVHFRYRNLTRVAVPWSFYGWRPFGSYEWYYDAKDSLDKNDRLSIQWFTAGISANLGSRTKVELWYRATENKVESWEPGHVIGTSVAVEF